uniref:TNFR-Cys domain-containing protein n=1 Tax=Panagrolaimus sp. ES5 TaxID=591445 RepID=A0AC34GUN3_9BILA
MRILLLCSIYFVVAATTYLEDKRFPAQIDDDDSEIVVQNFNKCSKDQYFDIYTASCQKCIKCPKGKFAINECKKFDNTECASCSNKDYSNTRAYRANCRGFPVKSGAYTIRNGMRKLESADVEVPWNNIGEVRSNRSKRIVQIKLQSIVRDRREDLDFDNEIPDLPGPFDDDVVDDDDSLEDDEYEEFYNGLDLSSEEFEDEPETVDAQIILPAARPIIDQTGVLEVMAMSDDLSSDSTEELGSSSESLESAELRRLNWNPSEGKLKKVKKIVEEEPLKEGKLKHVNRIVEDSDEEEIVKVEEIDDDDSGEDAITQTQTPKPFNFSESIKELKKNVLVWNLITKFFVFIAYCFAVMALFVAFRYAQNMRRQRTFNVQPLVMTPDQQYDLIRSVNYLQSKRRGPFKYEPLEEFV